MKTEGNRKLTFSTECPTHYLTVGFLKIMRAFNARSIGTQFTSYNCEAMT